MNWRRAVTMAIYGFGLLAAFSLIESAYIDLAARNVLIVAVLLSAGAGAAVGAFWKKRI